MPKPHIVFLDWLKMFRENSDPYGGVRITIDSYILTIIYD